MEFHNAKLLPKGMPELIAAVTPYDIYPYLNVVAHPHKKQRGLAGQAHTAPLTDNARIDLYPSIIGFHVHGEGTFSFKLWKSLLSVALHEIGHIVSDADERLRAISPSAYERDWEAHEIVERPAREWQRLVMRRILRDNPRLGQPLGQLTGYFGILVYDFKKITGHYSRGRVEEFRASATGGQLTVSDLIDRIIQQIPARPIVEVTQVASQDSPSNETKMDTRWLYNDSRIVGDMPSTPDIWDIPDIPDIPIRLPLTGWQKEWYHRRLIAARRVKEAVQALRLTRCYVSKSGKHYPMFNAGESVQVCNWIYESYRITRPTHLDKPPAPLTWGDNDHTLSSGQMTLWARGELDTDSDVAKLATEKGG